MDTYIKVPDKFALQESSGGNDIRGETFSVATRSPGRFPGSKGTARNKRLQMTRSGPVETNGQIKAVA